ncbi:deoxyribonuclease II family protein [Candidatus Reidiella endopervernicosa]|uniref:Uncharacterized protein n=1 Tax=Candidatus Reidiella endopervernicosa TaxID=2738883 RepID=A0A6N0HTC3_9GAMM|nr:hypothetical protein HUE57_04465 [Candidatus Reidiella endopervernicosa]
MKWRFRFNGRSKNQQGEPVDWWFIYKTPSTPAVKATRVLIFILRS